MLEQEVDQTIDAEWYTSAYCKKSTSNIWNSFEMSYLKAVPYLQDQLRI